MHLNIGQVNSSGFADSWAAARVCLFGPLLPGWKLVSPLPVAVERDGDCVVLYDDLFNVYGTGGSWDVAERDYKIALVEFFEIMADSDDDDSRKLVDRLKTYIERC